jgi:hypothetical protein
MRRGVNCTRWNPWLLPAVSFVEAGAEHLGKSLPSLGLKMAIFIQQNKKVLSQNRSVLLQNNSVLFQSKSVLIQNNRELE